MSFDEAHLRSLSRMFFFGIPQVKMPADADGEIAKSPEPLPSSFRVTEVRLKRKRSSGIGIMASATIVLDGMWAVRGLKIVMSDRGLFVAMPPSFPGPDGPIANVAYPANRLARRRIEDAVLSAYPDDDGEDAGVGARLKPIPPSRRGWIARDPWAIEFGEEGVRPSASW